MNREQEVRVLKSIEDAMWYLLNSGNPIQEAGLARYLKPLTNVRRELELELGEQALKETP